MMKRNILGSDRPCLLVAGTANAAEIYNKDGNSRSVRVQSCRSALFLQG